MTKESTAHDVIGAVQFKEKWLSDLKSLEPPVPAGLPKVDFVETFQAAQEVEPIPIRDSDKKRTLCPLDKSISSRTIRRSVDFKANLDACYSGIVVMLYFKPFDLRLRKNEQGEHVIERCGVVTKAFSSEKKGRRILPSGSR